MELKDAIINATIETLSMLGMSASHVLSTQQSALSSASQVNVIIGFTDGIKGNMMLEMSKLTALKIASVMMGGVELYELDGISISAVAELCNMIVGNVITLCDNDDFVNFSPPSVFIGDRVMLMMSRVETKKLHFEVDGIPLYVLASIENAQGM